MKTFTIGEVAKLLHLNVETLYFYDRKGLLSFVKRDEHNHRQFTIDDLEMVLTILHLKNAEVPLSNIKQFIEWRMAGDATLEQRYAFIQREEKKLEERIHSLNRAMKILKYKDWYYQTAVEAGTEDVHLQKGTYQYNEEAKNKFISMIDCMSEEEQFLFEIEKNIDNEEE